MLTDRAGRKIKIIQFSLLNGGITAFDRYTLHDRDLDPGWAEMMDSYDQRTGGITVADINGHAFKTYRVLEFTYNPTGGAVVTYTVPPEGRRCGSFPVGGKALSYSMGNVP
jgi:hypothetical protein